nr:DNA-dependent protein kinase catalytic subunit-like [Lytechinus pictus]
MIVLEFKMDEDLFSLLPTLFSDGNELGLDHVQLQHIVLGYKQLQKAKLLTRQTMNQASSILDCVMRGLVRQGENGQEARKMTPSEIDLGQSLLELAFQLGVQTNSLIDCMLDSTPIVGCSSRSVTSRLSASQTSLGILFLTTYKQPIMDQLVKHGQDTVYQLSDRVREDKQSIGMIVYGLLEHAVGSRDIRKRYGMAIYSAVLTQWDTLSNLGQDDDFVLNLIKKVLQIDFKFAKDSTHPAFRPVFNQYLGMLRDTKKSLAWKTQVLDVLYFFASVPEGRKKELKSALDLLVANHFPLKSTDLDVGSPSYNDYIMALNKILTSLVMSQSLMLLELIISILCRDEKHSYEDKIQGALSSFAKRLPPEKQSAAANIPFEIFKQDRRYSKEIRKAAIQRVCIPLLRQASRDAMVAFYKGHIHDLVSLLEARLTKNPLQAFENQLVSKICYFELIEVLYSRLNRDDLHTKDSALNREYCHGKVEKGNEMSTALTKASLGARNEDCRGETIAVDLRRQLHCAAFNCCAAIISCVQDNVKFFNAFIFSENLSKGQFLLDNLVDPKKEYNFAIEADAPVERKKRFVAIRSQARDANAPEESGYVSGPAHYLSSQYLSDSSLSEDVNQFDFSSSIRHFSGSVESQRDVAGGSQGSQGSQRLGPMVGRASLGARNEDCRGETIAVELRRQFHCAAFNCCAAIISCVQDNVKFFNAFIFSENLSKGQFLLDNLVDPKKEYNFAIEADAPVERKKRFVAIRSQAREANAPEESGYVSGPAHYLSSQYLSDSSLSEDVNQFDFSNSIRHFSGSVESQRDVAGGSQGSQGSQWLGPKVGRQDSKAVFSPGGEYLEMEEDALNQHECMAAMTGVLKHMTTNKINPDITKVTRAEEMPTWMSDLQKKLSSPSTEHNIKLFIIRLIINTQDVFQPYAKFWLTPLMQFLATARVQRDGMNYMVMDIMLVMLDWSTIAVPEDSRLASGVLRFLMENSYHERKSVMKNNLEVIKTLVECWKGVITVPTRVIYEKLQDRSPDKKDSAVGIHLLAVILANKLQPLSPTCDVDPDRFYSALASNIDNKNKAVHGAAAEVIGMAMKQMAETDQITDGHLHEVTYKQLHQLQLGSGKEVIFITCLHKIHLNYPVFTDRFMNKLLFMLPSIHGQPKTECLQIITARIEHIDNAFIEMKNKNILALLTHKDEADQLTSLKLVDGMLPKLQPSELLHLLPAVKGFVSHPSPTCRDAMYSILMWIYDNYREEDRRDGENADKALSIAKDTLLQGLSDQENYLRLRVSNFWSHETRLPKETLGRLIAMLRCMYSPSTENRYLGYATNLLLEMTSKSPDFKREIFEHPLSACKFEEVQIDHSWRQRHAAISTPKFVETQVGQSQGSMRGSPSSQSMGMGGGQLRATQATQQFAPTQENAAASRKNAYNWLTGSQDTFADYSSSSSSASESSLLFTIGSLPKRTDAFKSSKQDTGAGGSRGNDTRKAPSEGEKEIQRLKRRFLKDQSSQSAFFAKRATRQKQLREEVQRSQRERRFAQVTMYRQYRSGDLPDIQIKHSDIIAPLQALALRDSTLSRLLFCALFRGIFARIGDDCTEREAGLHVKEIETHLNQMLNESNQFDPAFISCILEIGFYHSKQLTLDPAAISQSSLTSRQLLIGIRVLEEVLIKKSWDDERSRKRARTSRPEQSQEMKNWIELARLYKAMGEFDVLRGIFGSLIETKDVTHKAIQAESRGDYEKALKLYSEVKAHSRNQCLSNLPTMLIYCRNSAQPPNHEMFNKNIINRDTQNFLHTAISSSQDVTQEEEDFWDEARLQCCNQLTKWDNMEALTDQIEGKETNDFSDLWNDSYKQEIYLPCMIRSKLKMLLEGSDDDSLTMFIDSSAKNQERRAILESRYTEELAALSMLKEDYNRAKYYLANCTSSFLQVRCLYMDKLCNILGDSPGGGGDTMETTGDGKFDDLVRREKVLLSMKMADSACQQSNFFVATKHLKSSHRDLADFEDLKPAWTHSYVSMIQRKALLLEPYERITSLLKTLEQLGKLPESQGLSGDLVLLCDHRILTSNTYQSMATALQDGKGEILERLSDEGKLDKLLAAAECQEKMHEEASSIPSWVFIDEPDGGSSLQTRIFSPKKPENYR